VLFKHIVSPSEERNLPPILWSYSVHNSSKCFFFNLCGDVDFEDVAGNASVCTPVPGGVGSVTTSVLAKHLLKAAKARRA
jgi:5,10-methylene-tetrahydrofolate dehydrogenase/methenyl tetrahydrofolate cyclohydrolase